MIMEANNNYYQSLINDVIIAGTSPDETWSLRHSKEWNTTTDCIQIMLIGY